MSSVLFAVFLAFLEKGDYKLTLFITPTARENNRNEDVMGKYCGTSIILLKQCQGVNTKGYKPTAHYRILTRHDAEKRSITACVTPCLRKQTLPQTNTNNAGRSPFPLTSRLSTLAGFK